MKIQKANVFPFVMMILSVIGFVPVYYMLTCVSVSPQYLIGLIFLIPAVIFTIVFTCSAKRKIKPKTANVITGVLSFVLPVIFLVVFICVWFVSEASCVTDPSLYGRVMDKTRYDERVNLAHFPENIPENKCEVEFFYCPVCFSDEKYELTYKASEPEIKRIMSGKYKWSGDTNSDKAKQYGVYAYDYNDWTAYVIDSGSGYSYGYEVNREKMLVKYFSYVW